MTFSSGRGSVNFDALQTCTAARRSLAELLWSRSIDQPDLDARILICAAAEIDHAALICYPDMALGALAAVRLTDFAERRLQGEPISRILGYREFWGDRFALTREVLDPRPDTETLVEAALAHTAEEPSRNWRILDLGTGSGAILGSLLRNLPNAWGAGTDISHEACVAARNNLAYLGVLSRAAVICANWTQALFGTFDIIVSNPPYIERDLIRKLEREVKDHDPIRALDGGIDGLDAYRTLAPRLKAHLAPGGLIAMEVGVGQCSAVKELFCASGLDEKGRKLDLSGHERIMLLG